MVGLETAAPVPAPEERFRDRIVADRGDVEFVAVPAKRGRPRKVFNQTQLTEVLRLYFVEKMSMRQVADILGVSHMSVYRMLSDPNIELLI
ncbi:MAG: helix-turn-helix domain-containing protein [Candidatus Micrarchaeota archaeon]